MLKFYYIMVSFYDIMLEFNENVIKFYDDLIPVIVEWVTLIPQLIAALLNNNSSQEGSENDPPDDPNGPGPGSDPNGSGSDPDDDDESKNKKLDKGKGKAKETTPELTPEQIEQIRQDEEETFQINLEKARLESSENARLEAFKKSKVGESSKDGANLQEREDEKARLDSLKKHEQGKSSKEGASLEQSDITETPKLGNTELSKQYSQLSDMRRGMAREFNEITEKLNSKKSNLSPEERERLLSQSVHLRSEVTNYDNYIQHLRDVLNIQSEDEYNSQDNSEEFSSEYSSDEESRSPKRPKR